MSDCTLLGVFRAKAARGEEAQQKAAGRDKEPQTESTSCSKELIPSLNSREPTSDFFHDILTSPPCFLAEPHENYGYK